MESLINKVAPSNLSEKELHHRNSPMTFEKLSEQQFSRALVNNCIAFSLGNYSHGFIYSAVYRQLGAWYGLDKRSFRIASS